jgi:hypothetical protein
MGTRARVALGVLAAGAVAAVVGLNVAGPRGYAAQPAPTLTLVPTPFPRNAPPPTLTSPYVVDVYRTTWRSAADDTSATAATARWDVVAVVSHHTGYDADLHVEIPDAPGNPVVEDSSARDTATGHLIDWVALNHNPGRLPLAPAKIQIRHTAVDPAHTPTGQGYDLQYVQSGAQLRTDQPTVNQPVGYKALVDLHPVRLAAGTTYTFQATNLADLWLLRSTGNPATWHLSRSRIGQLYHADADGTLVFAPPTTGMYGVLVTEKYPLPNGTVRITAG